MKPAHRVDQLYVISDLHLGGAPGFQIFGSSVELAWLIRHLADLDPAQELALVINGDFIDFLAEAPATYFDPFGAVRKLERIAGDPAFKAVFDAFPYFLGKARRRLIVNLGNHDLELALPWVRQRLAAMLTGGKEEAHARLHMVFDGSGVLCEVGTKSVLCLHGNEVDRWNPADFEKIRQIGRDAQLGRNIEPWVPNAGTQMVIDVMNRVKMEYPFVDLLKPEGAGMVPTLAACAPQLVADWERGSRLAGVGMSRLWAGVFKPDGMLGVMDEPDQAMPRLIDPLTASRARSHAEQQAKEIMRLVETQIRENVDPMDLVAGGDQQLGLIDAARNWFRDEPAHEVLREALEFLDKDRSFDLGDRDETAKLLDAEVSAMVDFTVAGHTHLERSLIRSNGGKCYFNCGTWARLIRIDPSVRGDKERFRQLFEVLKDGRMEQLDAHPGLVIKPCSVVAICKEGSAAIGEVRHVKTEQGKTELLSDEPKSRRRVE
jgi:UDP-2,3-diacylglucosamine pyrophosphatase LpxH